ncbi:MAG: YkgJ family cysteine cluster protein [Deltaproteobacteria bacterium]|nr:YkgJ family cysteine cluster protein [Deltaproteobacteria bacterium]MBW1874459.1 YkgJ family cysteine cluster protein [Deltaproteobacteria bacterium]MBW2209901.1 YkgJ family cysteine cluster protein [Deltaproteobacteria bacterium]MBW2213045.1 YkgJ family cysteine cluster protein [Deltaproteobacteria bacterium]MBW2378219.1 YkgJ family cysteine cluster protein [Deltaproteobacteria bacterium]
MAGNKKKKTHVRPLIPRPGARYACFGDGLCCTDIHGIGPLTKKEVAEMRRIDRKSAGWNEDHDDYMLHTAADGGCVFLMADQRCSVHAQLGAEAKPDGCGRFPLGLVATPNGGRITTEHRCPCRTMGDRPEIQPEDVESSISDGGSRPVADRRIKRIPMSPGEQLKFSEWEPIEAEYLHRLQGREALLEILDAEPFPKLHGSSWDKQADEFIDARDGSQFGTAMAWVGDTISARQNSRSPRAPGRPWAAAFDRAQARSPKARTSREVFGDWIADEIWSLKWAEDYDFALARQELATRVAIAEDICTRLRAEGARADRAAAEAVMMVEVVGESDFWTEVKDCMRPS